MGVVDEVRRFNRFYSARMGLYSRDYLRSGLGVTELRILFEIEAEGGALAREIAQKLELDEGYLSRVLKRFEALDWIERRADASDRRRKTLALMPAGRTLLDTMSERMEADTMRRLREVDTPTVLAAMRTLEAALTPVRAGDVALRDLESGDIGWLVERHGACYRDDPGLDQSFEAFVAQILSDFVTQRVEGRDRAFIAATGSQRLGSVFCVVGDHPGVAKLRLLWVEPAARGTGLGTRLVKACIGFAREAGFERMELLTLDTQIAARRLYRRHGFECTAQVPMTAFDCEVIEEIWTRDL